MKVRIVCISDTHNYAPGQGYTLPKGDVLIHAGDLTSQGTCHELKKALDWIEEADYLVKIIVAGNHDLSLEQESQLCSHSDARSVEPKHTRECRQMVTEGSSITYLQHESKTIEIPHKGVSFRVFGSPYSPARGNHDWAFQYGEAHAKSIWSSISDDVHVVVTHTPPAGHCDMSRCWDGGGCTALLQRLSQVRPMLHICGHCHEGRGAEVLRWNSTPGQAESVRTWEDPGVGNKKQSLLDLTGSRGGQTLEVGRESAIVNASIMAKSWSPGGERGFNKPIVVDIDLPCRTGGRS